MAEKQEILTPEQQLVNEKVNFLMEKVNQGYGEPLLVELADRLEKTVTEFHEEIATMLEELKRNSAERREKLKEIWEHRHDETPPESVKKTTVVEKEPERDLSAWEKRLENKESGIGVKKEVHGKKEVKQEKKKEFFKSLKKKM